jgi:hypothetical protein
VPSYQTPPPGQPASAPGYPNPHSAAAPSYQAADLPTQAYRPTNQPAHAPSFPGAEHGGSQAYPASNSYSGAQGFPSQSYRDQNFADARFSEPPTEDASFPETSFDQNFADANFANQGSAKQSFADASFPEPQNFDANFPDTSFPAAPAFGHHEPLGPDSMGRYGQPQGQSFETFAEETDQAYGLASPRGQVPPSDPRRQLQAFDALYDQPPQIALGATDQSRSTAQDFYEGERIDADFLDEGHALPPPGARAKMTIRGRSAFMVGSALLGAIALGGALAFAYKQSGGGLGNEQPPLVQADNRPVKELPDQPGGKEFPQKNKLIYDRLQNGDEQEAERLVPRQENVAVPALPPSTETAGTPAPVATTDLGTPTTQAVGGAEPIAVASVDDGSMPDGGPRKVKTMVVRPDGSVMAPPEPAAKAAAVPAAPVAPAAADPQLAAAAPPPAAAAPPPAAAAPPPAAAAPPPAAAAPPPAAAAPPPAAAAPQAAEAAPQEVASLQAPPPVAKPKPTAKPAAQQTAAATPAAAAPSKYVVQVGSKKNQTDALASFADMQQKYPSLLASYRPIVQKADLGAKGIWYRLRIGPIADKTAATKLCGQLKSQGLPDCLVMAQ